jgi:hypothetical protein
MSPVIETMSGQSVHLLHPDVDTIVFEDIAYALSRISRYNGHTAGEYPYSVGQHSLWCARIAVKHWHVSASTALKVLMHDAHEAYTGDIIRPIKLADGVNIDAIQDHLQRAIEVALGYPPPDTYEQKIINTIDNYALAVESLHLMPSKGIDWDVPTPPPEIQLQWDDPVSSMFVYGRFASVFELLKAGDKRALCE